MSLRVLPFVLLLLLAPSLASATVLVIDVEGMTCAGCRTKVEAKLTALDFIDRVSTTDSGSEICATTTGAHDEAAISGALTDLGYTLASLRTSEVCPKSVAAVKEPWEGWMEGRDVQCISDGERVTLKDHLAEGKFTIVDFGAPWCGPCHEAAETLANYLDAHSDVAVRVGNLGAEDVTGSYALPAAQQHLQYAPGIPWFQAYNAKGKTVYSGLSLDELFDAIEKQRK